MFFQLKGRWIVGLASYWHFRLNIEFRTMKKSLPSRKPARAAWWDYGFYGAYFVTIRTDSTASPLLMIDGDEVRLTDSGRIIDEIWQLIPNQFSGVKLDTYCIMPDHVHGIVMIEMTDAQSDFLTASAREKKTSTQKNVMETLNLSKIIRWFKGRSTFEVRRHSNSPFAWQLSFYDRIIRDPEEHESIRTYILNNPINWRPRNHP